ncbi:MerC domain-containing protein [Spirosoma rhododendri]|uniref:MerC domain-containing protein n=1 Tax=Spirosoma rhododendri TaxID=2728024 RepID=A0A7L5DGK0_9BACT|nr:MerC domain-containing protein [Spirosoma rhododendri]QJD77055.1 MerC domain-containing protein [Spirosoma rhododendri]
MNQLLSRHRADYVGITGSVLCIIHCLLTPVLVMTSALLNYESLRVGFLSLDYLFIGINVIAVWSAARCATGLIRWALGGFLALFAVGLLLEGQSELFEYVAYAASAGLVVTHLINIRQGRTTHAHC